MTDNAVFFVFVAGLFLVMLILLAVGHRIGMHNVAQETDHDRAGLISVGAAIYGLLGLMVAFTFSGAANRYEVRRALTVQEANVIGTAYLRLDLLPVEAQPALRDQFRHYAEARLAAFQLLPDFDASIKQTEKAAALQREIWNGSVAALRGAPATTATSLVLPALNDMINITVTRANAARTHTPMLAMAVLAVLAMFCAMLAGHGLAGGKRLSTYLHMIGFALVVTTTIFVIVDLDHPRVGWISLEYADQPLIDVIAGMK